MTHILTEAGMPFLWDEIPWKTFIMEIFPTSTEMSAIVWNLLYTSNPEVIIAQKRPTLHTASVLESIILLCDAIGTHLAMVPSQKCVFSQMVRLRGCDTFEKYLFWQEGGLRNMPQFVSSFTYFFWLYAQWIWLPKGSVRIRACCLEKNDCKNSLQYLNSTSWHEINPESQVREFPS